MGEGGGRRVHSHALGPPPVRSVPVNFSTFQGKCQNLRDGPLQGTENEAANRVFFSAGLCAFLTLYKAQIKAFTDFLRATRTRPKHRRSAHKGIHRVLSARKHPCKTLELKPIKRKEERWTMGRMTPLTATRQQYKHNGCWDNQAAQRPRFPFARSYQP